MLNHLKTLCTYDYSENILLYTTLTPQIKGNYRTIGIYPDISPTTRIYLDRILKTALL